MFAKKTPAKKIYGTDTPHTPRRNVEDVLPGVDPDEKNKRPITRKVMDRFTFNIDFGGWRGKRRHSGVFFAGVFFANTGVG